MTASQKRINLKKTTILKIDKFFCVISIASLFLHLINIHYYTFFSFFLSATIMLVVATLYSSIGGFFKFYHDKVLFYKNLLCILIVSIVAFFMDFYLGKKIMPVAALLGYVIGFFDFRYYFLNN